MRLVVTCCLAAVVEVALVAQVPQIPRSAESALRKLPSLDSLTKGTPPLTTEFEDALGPLALRADTFGLVPKKMTDLPRAADGGFMLKPGLWESTFQSYCLAVATYAPGGGDGYLYAPLKGSREDAIGTILRGTGTHTEIPQGKIQLLLWAIIARSKVADLPPDQRQVATTLLTPEQIKSINSDGLGLIPVSERTKLFGSLPASVRKTLETEADLRDRLQRASSTYQDIQRVAVLAGAPPPVTGPHASRGQWSRAPGGGYLVRYFPDGFSRTRVQVLMPEPVRVKFDKLNRVVLIEDARGGKTETQYDDSIPPLTVPQDKALKGYAFKLIRITTVRPSGPPEVHEIKDKGWTFVQSTGRRGPVALPAIFEGPRPTVVPARWQDTGSRFDHLRERYEQAEEIKDRYDTYRDVAEHLHERPSADSVDQLGNLEHYRDGARAAAGDDLNEQLEWLRDHQQRENSALVYAHSVISSLPTTPTDADGNPVVDPPPQPSVPMYLPPTGAAVPAGHSHQRLGMSSRSGG
ncbi:MAG TPA: hypothetical protein VLT86_15025 [Vicinamibacterales bacterium]|nr:hypothetical protein [Vicinamibacterales bacterium]